MGWRPGDPANKPYDGLIKANRYGHNYRITEMQAVLLRGGLARLEDEMRVREESAAYLREQLSALGGPLQVAPRDPRVTRQSYYALTLHYDAGKADGLPRGPYLRAARAEGLPLDETYGVVYKNALLNLYDRTSPIPYRDASRMQDYATLDLPNAERACNETAVLLSHTHLLGDGDYLDQLVAAVKKINDHPADVKRYAVEND